MLIYLQMIESEEDKSKFEAIYNKYRQLMFVAANRILKNQYDAEDAVHQAFVSIIDNLSKVKEVNCPETRSYVVIITENKAIDIIRSRKRLAGEDLTETLPGMDIPLPGDNGLADALAKLPARYREVLLLRFDNGYSTKEIAKMMDMTEGSMQKLIWRAKDALRKQLDHDDKDVFRRTVDWGIEHSITTATFHILTPYPGTRLFQQMERDGRITSYDWSKYDTRTVVYKTVGLTAEELKAIRRNEYNGNI